MASTSEGRFLLAELLVTVGLPTVALVALSSDAALGPRGALIAALLPPLVWVGVTWRREGRASPLSVLIAFSVLLSGGIGLLELDTRWFALKEAAVALLLGALTLASAWTPWAVVPAVLSRLLDLERTHAALAKTGGATAFDRVARLATVAMGAISMASAALNFALARALVRSPTGTPAFAEELGWYNLLVLPVVTLPVVFGMGLVFRWALPALEAATGVGLDELLKTSRPPPPG